MVTNETEKLKKRIGRLIRKLREEQGFNQDEFDEEGGPSGRALQNIEAGKSMPQLPTLLFLSEKLGVDVNELINGQKNSLPEAYLTLKSQLIRYTSYRHDQRLKGLFQLIDWIDDEFYDIIPSEEQLAIDLLKALHLSRLGKKLHMAKDLLKEHFQKIRCLKRYDENELILIQVYFSYIFHRSFEQSSFEEVLTNLLVQSDDAVGLKAVLLIQILISAANYFTSRYQYNRLEIIIEKTKQLMKRNEDFQKAPIVAMVEGKYLLFHKGERFLANELYKKGSAIASMFDDDYLAGKILEEWNSDIEKYSRTINQAI